MSTFLFDKIIFGPVHSRRLGISLGINLLPVNAKVCTFDCLYCECGFNFKPKDAHIPSRAEVRAQLHDTLANMQANGDKLDVITFAGNGEPTIHAEFAGIVDDTIALRDNFFPSAKISVLSNSTMIHKPEVFAALNKVDNNILKMDSAIDSTIKLLNQPNASSFSRDWLVEHLKRFDGKLIIQTLFLQGEINNGSIDNTTQEEVAAWVDALKEINPQQVMIYTLDRDTPTKTLRRASHEQLVTIAEKVRNLGLDVSISD
jgi:wyosine [tRNA(Phe)-imidazoG37] synthetase (radical SAM superfamily)